MWPVTRHSYRLDLEPTASNFRSGQAVPFQKVDIDTGACIRWRNHPTQADLGRLGVAVAVAVVAETLPWQMIRMQMATRDRVQERLGCQPSRLF